MLMIHTKIEEGIVLAERDREADFVGKLICASIVSWYDPDGWGTCVLLRKVKVVI
jgi:hypothetical protein